MSNIDFQNGILCGLAMKGLIKTGSQYEPIIWNDEGIYDYFYIDFKRALAPFTVGMLSDSLLVYGNDRLVITGFQKVSASTIKVFCNIAGLASGVIVVHKKNTFLSYSDGRSVPEFSSLFFVSGIPSVFNFRYIYDEIRNVIDILGVKHGEIIEEGSVEISFMPDINSLNHEIITCQPYSTSVIENLEIRLT